MMNKMNKMMRMNKIAKKTLLKQNKSKEAS